MSNPARAEEAVEREAKFHASGSVFKVLADCEDLFGWTAVERRMSALRDIYWDTPDRRLLRQSCSLRVRERAGEVGGELTFKAPRAAAAAANAVLERLEMTVSVRSGAQPADWSESAGGRAILERVAGFGELQALIPLLVLLNPRRDITFRKDPSSVVLSLDTVEIEGRPYRRRFVEIEMIEGVHAEFALLVERVRDQYRLRPSRSSKVEAAYRWLSEMSRGAVGGTVR